MRVALVTTWDKACGIAEHSALLKQHTEAADPTLQLVPINNLHPAGIADQGQFDAIWLNYHAALHSQWTPEAIRIHQGRGLKVGVTYHDTGVPNSLQCKGICRAADAFVVHEPYDDLDGRGFYWRMGIPDWSRPYLHNDWAGERPILGTVGFPFPWKNYDDLARLTRENGWALLLIAPTATVDDVKRWRDINYYTRVEPAFLDRWTVGSWLAGCDATAFCYTCANTGQSGAICQGIAARKPVIAFDAHICRQFRALYADLLGAATINWAKSFADVGRMLREIFPHRCDSGIVALAEQDSWTSLGVKYAALLRELCP